MGLAQEYASYFRLEALTFRHVIEIKPSAFAYIHLAWAYFALDKYKQAFSELDTAEAFDNKNYLVPTMRGVIYYDRGKIKKALECYNKAVEIEPMIDAEISDPVMNDIRLTLTKERFQVNTSKNK